MIKAASVQFNHRPNDKDYNLQQIDNFCKQAAKDGVDILAFPEMCITGYWHVRNLSRDQVEALSENIESGPSVKRIKRPAKEYNLLIGTGLIEKAPNGELYNSYVVALPDGRIHCHRKLHCFISEHMSSGSEYTVFDTHLGVKVGILICYDNNLVENARITALEGADILLAPHQTGGCGSRSPHGMTTIDPYYGKIEKPTLNPSKRPSKAPMDANGFCAGYHHALMTTECSFSLAMAWASTMTKSEQAMR